MNACVSIIDYDCGNLRSLQRSLVAVGASDVRIISSSSEVEHADCLILPGVGAFGQAVNSLKERGLFQSIIHYAASGRPLLGICLGMQLLFDESEEIGLHSGLGLIPGRVTMLDTQQALPYGDKVPNVGWLPIMPATPTMTWDGTILEPLSGGEYMYFVHSYVARPSDLGCVTAVAEHGGRPFCAVASYGNVMGCQFHPEKSATAGLNILRQFLVITESMRKG